MSEATLSVTCGACGARHQVAMRARGKQFACRSCQKTVSVPAGEADSPASRPVRKSPPVTAGSPAKAAPAADSGQATEAKAEAAIPLFADRQLWIRIGVGLLVFYVGSILAYVAGRYFPVLGMTLFWGYLAIAVLLQVGSWVWALVFSIRNTWYSVPFFFFLPFYHVRYAVRHWPSTKPVFALAFGSIAVALVPALLGRPPLEAEKRQQQQAQARKAPPAQPFPGAPGFDPRQGMPPPGMPPFPGMMPPPGMQPGQPGLLPLPLVFQIAEFQGDFGDRTQAAETALAELDVYIPGTVRIDETTRTIFFSIQGGPNEVPRCLEKLREKAGIVVPAPPPRPKRTKKNANQAP